VHYLASPHVLHCTLLCAIPYSNILISAQMGPGCVLQVLLRSAFGMPLMDTDTDTPSRGLQGPGPNSEMHTRAKDFHSSCGQTVYASSNRSVPDRSGGVTVRAVLFDTFHSVSAAAHLAL
jgi:hypothetical protein